MNTENDNNTTDLNTNAPSVPDVDSESEEELHEEQSQSTQTDEPHLTHDVHPAHNHFISSQTALQAIIWINYFWTILLTGYSVVSKVSKGVLRSVQSQTYVFFTESIYPYRLQDVCIQGPGIAPVEWYYDADKQLFISANQYETSDEYFPRHFPYLSGEIRYNDLVLHDISEFLNEVRWVGIEEPPSPKHLLSVWSLQSGKVFTPIRDNLSLFCIMSDGEQKIIPIIA